MTHEDFRYVPESEFTPTSHGPLPVTPEAKALRKPNQIARDAATLCWRISNTEPVANWKGRIEAAPEELRECLRELLRQKYRAMQHAAKGKRSAVGDQAMLELGRKYGG